jgi:histidine triad (HIT) family protein
MDGAPGCVFCAIVAGEEPANMVLEDYEVLAFMNRAQLSAGHVPVIPKAHRVDLRDFEPSLNAAIMHAVSAVAGAVTMPVAPDGLTSQHNIGEAGGQDVFHAHFHVYAPQHGDGLHRTYPQSPPHPPRSELDALARRIRAEISSGAE